MAWNPLKRLSTTPRSTAGQGTAASLEEIEVENAISHLTNLSEVSRKVYKEGKKFTETVHGVSKSEAKLTQDLSLSPICHYDDELRNLMEEYHSFVSLSEPHCNDLILILQRAFVTPMKRYHQLINTTLVSLRKRDQAMQECQKLQAKLEKLQEKDKTGPVVVKLEMTKKALTSAKQEVATINQELLQNFPKIFNARLDYFKPCLESVVRAKVLYSGRCSSLLNDLVKSPLVKVSPSDDCFLRNIEQQLAEIKALSIVADD